MNLLKTLKYSYNTSIESAYIIRIKGHQYSEKKASECLMSCQRLGQNVVLWDAFDGTDNTNIVIPDHSKNASYLSWLKIFDHHLSISEIACVFSHFSLWVRCLELDRPIVILEHDAILLKNVSSFPCYNSILYLGSLEQKRGSMATSIIPPHGTVNHNYHFICRAHAYAIDPPMAKNLVAHIIQRGIAESLDVMIRADLFNISQVAGLCAFDNFTGETTITNRKKDVSLKQENVGRER
jgi:hypothetical protein